LVKRRRKEKEEIMGEKYIYDTKFRIYNIFIVFNIHCSNKYKNYNTNIDIYVDNGDNDVILQRQNALGENCRI